MCNLIPPTSTTAKLVHELPAPHIAFPQLRRKKKHLVNELLLQINIFFIVDYSISISFHVHHGNVANEQKQKKSPLKYASFVSAARFAQFNSLRRSSDQTLEDDKWAERLYCDEEKVIFCILRRFNWAIAKFIVENHTRAPAGAARDTHSVFELRDQWRLIESLVFATVNKSVKCEFIGAEIFPKKAARSLALRQSLMTPIVIYRKLMIGFVQLAKRSLLLAVTYRLRRP